MFLLLILSCNKVNKNSETQRLVQNVNLKLEKIKMVLVKPTMVKHPLQTKLIKRCGVYARDTYVTSVSVIDPSQILVFEE